MGQTLSHGVYLPNEGERNCYAGLASNWQILNTAVGNIAEKAPLVHTHGNITNDGKVGTDANKPLITGTGGAVQAGSFGASANTFCEGNDSRLSDARTPLAHTHTKSDVTDLLNSNFIPSANNAYDLGSSSYQWKSVYANAYYLGTTAFGDIVTHNASEFVDVTSAQTIAGTKTFSDGLFVSKSTAGDLATLADKSINSTNEDANGMPLTGHTNSIKIKGSQYNVISCMLTGALYTNGDTSAELRAYKYKDITSNALLSLRYSYSINSGTVIFSNIGLIMPNITGTTDLGTSTNKWKSLNGINPGALSLPSGVRQSIIEYITDVNLGWGNQITAARDGYIVVTINDTAGNSIYLFNNTKQYSNGSYGNGSQGTGRLTCMLPVNEGDAIIIFIKATALSDVFSAYLYVMNGNVNALPSS